MRRFYTGEPQSAVMRPIIQARETMDTDDRRWLLDVLHGHESTPRPRVRDMLLPDACDASQRRLEAEVLAAVADLSAVSVFRMVRPEPDALWLHVNTDVLPALLARVLPRVTADGVAGIAGVRMRQHRRHIELHEPLGSARVLLAGVSQGQQTAALSYPRSLPGEPLWDRKGTTSAEAAVCTPTHAWPVALASGVLRRVWLFTELPRVVWTAGTCSVEWLGGWPIPQMVKALRHPVFGLAGVTVAECYSADRRVIVFVPAIVPFGGTSQVRGSQDHRAAVRS
ncbi:hypothetical protein [Kutzneria albida]|nr:hypothetical protein [Kutzneria albida]